MLRKGRGGLYKAPMKEERRKQRLRGERDKIKFHDFRSERRQVAAFRKEDESNVIFSLIRQ